MREGAFRDDLYYRINVLSLHVPPLRERTEDIEWLLDRFFAEFAARIGSDAVGVSALGLRSRSRTAGRATCASSKPHGARRRSRSGRWIMPADLFPDLRHHTVSATDVLAPLGTAREDAEKRHIQRALAMTGGAILPAAKALGISRTTLWEKMRR